MICEHLLAKSHPIGQKPWPEQLLCGHLKEVMLAASDLVDATGRDQLIALGLNAEEHFDRFRRLARLAAVLHDLGKANDHFQGMLQKNDPKPQGIRHEWVSLWIIREKLTGWLRERFSGLELDIVGWAVAGHHPKYNQSVPPSPGQSGSGPEMTVYLDHPDFGQCLALIRTEFALPPIPKMDRCETLSMMVGGLSEYFRDWLTEDAQVAFENFADSDVRLLAALKNTLIGADIAGSALPKTGLKDAERRNWIRRAFNNCPSSAQLEAVVRARLGSHPIRPFQELIGQSSASVTLVTAGCGSGKTIGAYLWAARQHPGKRLYFCYPTTGTATEGYRGYLHYPESEKLTGDQEMINQLRKDLFHSRRDIDFEAILRTGADDESDEIRIQSIDAWHTAVVACTCDTVLGVMQNNRRGLLSWPAIAGSAIIFDEIHSYDDKLFGALIEFLSRLSGIPVLLMTASLPKGRLELLRRETAFVGRTMKELPGPLDIETIPRYRWELTLGDIVQRVRAEIAAGGKVLWVSNTVQRVIESANNLPESVIYHSRFKYIDRVKRHGDVVDGFNPALSKHPIIACGSQVTEVSLDLKGCTLLVTELAPVPALIQRLGRLNRDAETGSLVRPFIVIDIDDSEAAPYTPTELREARNWLNKLAGRDLDQRDLAEAWNGTDGTDQSEMPGLVRCEWLEGGPLTRIGDLREPSPGITILMASDCDRLEADPKEKYGRYTLPMPPPGKDVQWRTRSYRGIPVVEDETIDYKPNRGATWRK